MKPLCIFSSLALQLNMSGAWWELLLVHRLALGLLHNSFGGCLNPVENA
jgi:hypothetical protein